MGSNGPGHMTKMAATSVYGKNLFKQPLGQLNSNFIWKPLRMGSNGPGHMTKMAATSIYGKNPLSENKNANDLGTWYVTLGMWGLPSLFKK